MLLQASVFAFAQSQSQSTDVRERTTMLGVGSANVLDTYLSPYSYTGVNLRFHHDSRRLTHWLSRTADAQSQRIGVDSLRIGADDLRVSFRTSADVDFSSLENPARNVDEYAGGVRYSLAWQYALIRPERLRSFLLEAGPMLTGYVGAIYNERNGNNPAQAKASLTLDASVNASWSFQAFRRLYVLHASAAVPLLGLAFSPRYGQSYYEAFNLGQEGQTLVFAHTGNMPSLRGALMLDIPLRPNRRTTLRVGYQATLMQSTFRHLRYHSYTHAFLIGFTQSFLRL